jgi:hypothetical protein
MKNGLLVVLIAVLGLSLPSSNSKDMEDWADLTAVSATNRAATLAASACA